MHARGHPACLRLDLACSAMRRLPYTLQLLGFSDLYAASLMATFSIGCALGGLLGGCLCAVHTRLTLCIAVAP